MTESEEIIKNAREAEKNGDITKEQLHTVYYIVARADVESEME